MTVNRGKLIAFEGLDGCGKSTQLALLADALDARGVDVVRTREPTEGEHGRRIREMARAGVRVDPREELSWFVADRREHVERVIEPALAAGRTVLSDRYYLSSVAYQGARGLDPDGILAESEAAFPHPTLAILVEIEPERGLERVKARLAGGGIAEPLFEEVAFLREVARVFAGLRLPYLVRVPGDDTPEAVHRRILRLVDDRLEWREPA
jgi:dTMP kinase